LLFAEREFILSEQQQDGATTRDHLKILWKNSGHQPELLATAPPLPQAAAHIWGWFCEARADAPQGQRITAQVLQSIEWATGARFELWERQALRRLDQLFFKVKNDN